MPELRGKKKAQFDVKCLTWFVKKKDKNKAGS